MILALSPSTRRARWTVVCDVHGHVSQQTDFYYSSLAAEDHRCAVPCAERFYVVSKSAWTVYSRALQGGVDFFAERSSKALAIKAARRDEEGGR